MMSPTSSGLVALDSPLTSADVVRMATTLKARLAERGTLRATNAGRACWAALDYPDHVVRSPAARQRFLELCARFGIERTA